MSLTIKLHVHHHRHRPSPPAALLSRSPRLYATKLRPEPIYHINALSSLVHSCLPGMRSNGAAQPPIKSSLIDPDGGAPVDLVVPEAEASLKAREAESLPKVLLTRIDLEWVHVISEGWASPLKGFMREKEYLQSLHFNCLRMEDGSIVNVSLPIVLAIDDVTKEAIGSSLYVALLGPDSNIVGILWSIEIYKHNKEERIARTRGTTAPGLPYVEEAIAPAGNWLIGGDLEVLKPIKYNNGLDHYRLSPQAAPCGV